MTILRSKACRRRERVSLNEHVKNRIESFRSLIEGLEQEQLTADSCSQLFIAIGELRGHINGREIKPFIHLIISLLQQDGVVFFKKDHLVYTNKQASCFSKYANGDEFAVYRARFDDRIFDLHTIASLLLTYSNLLPNSFAHPFILEIPHMIFKKHVILDKTKIDYEELRFKHLAHMKTALNDMIGEHTIFTRQTI